MLNALWRIFLTLVYLLCLFFVLAIIWDVPKYIGYPLPDDFAKLPSTLLIILAMITGVLGTWSRKHMTIQRNQKKDISSPEAYPVSPDIRTHSS